MTKLHCITHFRSALGRDCKFAFCYLELEPQEVAGLRELITGINMVRNANFRDMPAVPSVEVAVETNLEAAKQAVIRAVQVDLGLGDISRPQIAEINNVYEASRYDPEPAIEAAGYSANNGYGARRFSCLRIALDAQTAANRHFYPDMYSDDRCQDTSPFEINQTIKGAVTRLTKLRIAAAGQAPVPPSGP
jgi:hypothetical protein